eukprot:TRINITY_DN5841_c0_g1_i1.p1 TRINITY_DN5841_c0_g1~~TRINITY_DN5841_c0_g1_i1.p1  ORF type:complete len:720 (+),score=81.09 TRINITY_DN5841_c0_g1_i1:154-2313(+)
MDSAKTKSQKRKDGSPSPVPRVIRAVKIERTRSKKPRKGGESVEGSETSSSRVSLDEGSRMSDPDRGLSSSKRKSRASAQESRVTSDSSSKTRSNKRPSDKTKNGRPRTKSMTSKSSEVFQHPHHSRGRKKSDEKPNAKWNSDSSAYGRLSPNVSPKMSPGSSPATLRRIASAQEHERILERSGSISRKEGQRKLSVDIDLVAVTKNGKERMVLKSATLSGLIAHFAILPFDTATLHNFIYAHARVLSSTDVVDCIIKRFHLVGEGSNQEQLRLLNLLKMWISIDPNTILADDALHEQILDFLRGVSASHGAVSTYLRLNLERLKEGIVNENQTAPAISSASSKIFNSSNSTRVNSFDEEEFARYLCVLEQKMISNIPVSELHSCKWTELGKTPNIDIATDFSNKLSYWLALQVAIETKSKDQLKIYSSLMGVARHLVALNNYNSLFAFYLAFQQPSFRRLFRRWKHSSLPRKAHSMSKQLQSLMNPLQNFSAYRASIAEATVPLIPCVEITLKDLLYQSEGSPDYIDTEAGTINVLKMDSIGQLISTIRASCSSKYDFEKEFKPELVSYFNISCLYRDGNALKEELENLSLNLDWSEIAALNGPKGTSESSSGLNIITAFPSNSSSRTSMTPLSPSSSSSSRSPSTPRHPRASSDHSSVTSSPSPLPSPIPNAISPPAYATVFQMTQLRKLLQEKDEQIAALTAKVESLETELAKKNS